MSLFFAMFVQIAFFFAMFVPVAFFCDYCSSRSFFSRFLFTSHANYCSNRFFFCDFRPGRFFAIFAHVPFFADAFQTHFSRISFEKVRQRQSPNAFLQVANRIFEHNFFIAQLQKSDFAGHRFFFGDFCSHRISAPFFWWAHVSNAILLHFFRCGHASIAFSQVLE